MSNQKIIVLGGAGAMGQVIVRDLCETSPAEQILVADYNLTSAQELSAKLNDKRVTVSAVDLTDRSSLIELLHDCSLVINSTPYIYNLQVMEAALSSGSHYIDLGGLFHTTKEQLKLNEKFGDAGLIAVLGMGAAPGITNLMAAEAVAELDTIESIDISVGCIDFAMTEHPLLMPYSIDTIFDEYTKEPMSFEKGAFVANDPMCGELEILFPAPVGKCKAIMTLHSEVLTLPNSFKTKGINRVTFRLGLPQEMHEKLKFLVKLGFGADAAVDEKGVSVSPRRMLETMLKKFPVPQTEADDCEVLRVDAHGNQAGISKLVRCEAIVHANKRWNLSCGAFDTGVPPSIVSTMILNDEIKERGVLPPESCIPRQLFFAQLASRQIHISKTVIE